MYIFGARGHGKVIASILLANKEIVLGFIDDHPTATTLMDLPVFHSNELENLNAKKIVIGIGDNKTRKNIAQKLIFNSHIVVHPTAEICNTVKIAEGTVICPKTVINTDVIIGSHCIVNTGAIIEHDCILENFVHVSPNAAIAGEVKIGEGTHIGIGACVIPGIKIGKWATVGAGAVVIKDVPDGAVVVGNPAKPIDLRKGLKVNWSKRIFDLVFSLFSLILVSWVLLISWLLACIDTRSTGILLQTRIGQFGEPFTIYKLRTMYKQRKKMSKTGAFLRRFKLDELPQFINVLQGTMSIVGPRPDVPGYYDALQGEARNLLKLKPGLTSLATIKYENEEDLLAEQEDWMAYNNSVIFPDKIQLNLKYYSQSSFWGDMGLILRTLLVVLK